MVSAMGRRRLNRQTIRREVGQRQMLKVRFYSLLSIDFTGYISSQLIRVWETWW
jgi:hypothetical protein